LFLAVVVTVQIGIPIPHYLICRRKEENMEPKTAEERRELRKNS